MCTCLTLCLGFKYLIVFNCVVAEALALAKALRDLLRVTIRVDGGERRQVPVYLGERVGTVHVGLPNRTTGLGTVATLVINWACEREKKIKKHVNESLLKHTWVCGVSGYL